MPDLRLNVDAASGHVGIGTTQPSSKLSVAGIGASADAAALSLSEVNVRNWIVGAGITTSGNLSIQNGGGGIDPLTITGSGYVGIGTNSPNAELHVNGQLMVGTGSPAWFASIHVRQPQATEVLEGEEIGYSLTRQSTQGAFAGRCV